MTGSLEIFGRFLAYASKRLEELHMTMYFLDTERVLCRDNLRLSRLVLNNDTIEVKRPRCATCKDPGPPLIVRMMRSRI